MSITLYFSKVSLNTSEVFELVDDYSIRFKITNDIIRMLKNGYSFSDLIVYEDDDGNKYETMVKYTLSIKEKDESVIHGVLYREGTLFVKERDEKNDTMRSRPVENTEDIEFYYDVLNEYVSFYARRRFGRMMFNSAFEKMLNSASEETGLKYFFYVSTYNEGMSIEEIKESIRNDKNIKQLTIIYRPANPDAGLIEDIKKASDKELLREANATERTVIYKAKGDVMINGGAPVIQSDLQKLVDLNEDVSIEELTKRGYAEVRSENQNGDVKSTTEAKPFEKKIEDVVNFVETAKSGILQILRKAVKS